MKQYLIKYICASFLTLMSGMMSAQNLESITIDFTYSVDLSEDTKLNGTAVLTYQGTSYKAVGNGVESYCDGTSVWTVDMTSKEVYIEAITPEIGEYMRDLASKLSGLKDGASAEFIAPEGQTVKVRINSMKKSDGMDISSFRPTHKFDSSWVVTDLR